jgi:hypothetical protein
MEQMTLGELIAVLRSMPFDAMVTNLHRPHSYRGWYNELAFERGDGTRLASELLNDCQSAMWETFIGYKGGEYTMNVATPLWIANYGCLGDRLLALHEGGGLHTCPDDE